MQLFRALGEDPFEGMSQTLGAEQRFALFQAARRVLARASATETVVVLLEDLHAADVSSGSVPERCA